MRYLVTGGAGFIGSHMVDSLVLQGHEVRVVDNLSTGRLENLSQVMERVTFVHGSVLDPFLVDELVEQSDIVIHLAASVGVRLIIEKPLRSFLTNIRGSENVLEAAHRHRRKVLLASTSEIYGKSADVPLHEEGDRVLGSNTVVRWGYSTSKAADEILAFAYFRERGLPVIVARLFNTVGPRQTGAYGMVLPRFIAQALSGEPLTVYGDGNQTRCFCHVGDVVHALTLLLDTPAAEGDVFNVGSTEEVSMAALARRVIYLTNSSSAVRFVSYNDAYEQGFEDMRRRVPDTSKINRLSGWHPTRNLDDIIRELAGQSQPGLATGVSGDGTGGSDPVG